MPTLEDKLINAKAAQVDAVAAKKKIDDEIRTEGPSPTREHIAQERGRAVTHATSNVSGCSAAILNRDTKPRAKKARRRRVSRL